MEVLTRGGGVYPTRRKRKLKEPESIQEIIDRIFHKKQPKRIDEQGDEEALMLLYG